MEYDSDSDFELFSWHRPKSVGDLFKQCGSNALTAGVLCIFCSIEAMVTCWIHRPWREKTDQELEAQQRKRDEKEHQRNEKIRLQAEERSLKIVPVPLPPKRTYVASSGI